MTNYLAVEELLQLHYCVIEDYGGAHGVRSEPALQSLAEAPQQMLFGNEQYSTLHEKAAVLLRNGVMDHLYVDGNKRTAITVTAVFLQRNGVMFVAEPLAIADFVVAVAVEHLGLEQIVDWLLNNTTAA